MVPGGIFQGSFSRNGGGTVISENLSFRGFFTPNPTSPVYPVLADADTADPLLKADVFVVSGLNGPLVMPDGRIVVNGSQIIANQDSPTLAAHWEITDQGGNLGHIWQETVVGHGFAMPVSGINALPIFYNDDTLQYELAISTDNPSTAKPAHWFIVGIPDEDTLILQEKGNLYSPAHGFEKGDILYTGSPSGGFVFQNDLTSDLGAQLIGRVRDIDNVILDIQEMVFYESAASSLPFETGSNITRLDEEASYAASFLQDGEHDLFSSNGTPPAPYHSGGNLIVPITKMDTGSKILNLQVNGDEVLAGYGVRYKGIIIADGGNDYLAAQVSFYNLRQKMFYGYFDWNGTDAWSWVNTRGDIGSVTFVTNNIGQIIATHSSNSEGSTYGTFPQMSLKGIPYGVYPNDSINANQVSLLIRDGSGVAPATLPAGTRIIVERRLDGIANSNARLNSDALLIEAGVDPNVWVSGDVSKP